MFNEQYKDDMSAQDAAEHIYDKIISYFENYGIKNYKKFGTDMYGFNIEKELGHPLYVVLGQHNKNTKGGFGFIQNDRERPFVLVYLLDGELSKDDLKKLQHTVHKTTIIHELIHHLDELRYTQTFKYPYDNVNEPKEVMLKKYYNSAPELNTHYHEVVTFFRDLLKNPDSIKALRGLYQTTQKFTDMLYDTVFRKVDKHITVKNRQRLKKRIARMVEQEFGKR